jgi:hypothetical protein
MRIRALRAPAPLLRFAFVALLALGATPGIPGFDLLLALPRVHDTGVYTGDFLHQRDWPDRHARAEQSTTDLIAAPSVWSAGQHVAWLVTLSNAGLGLPRPPLSLTITAGPGSTIQTLAALIGLPLLSVLGLRQMRQLRAPPLA